MAVAEAAPALRVRVLAVKVRATEARTDPVATKAGPRRRVPALAAASAARCSRRTVRPDAERPQGESDLDGARRGARCGAFGSVQAHAGRARCASAAVAVSIPSGTRGFLRPFRAKGIPVGTPRVTPKALHESLIDFIG